MHAVQSSRIVMLMSVLHPLCTYHPVLRAALSSKQQVDLNMYDKPWTGLQRQVVGTGLY